MSFVSFFAALFGVTIKRAEDITPEKIHKESQYSNA